MALKQFKINNLYIGLTAAAIVLLLSLFGVLDNFEAQTLDYRFLLRGHRPPAEQVKIIEIDDESITQFGEWPWPRGYYAGLLSILEEFKPKVVGFDIVFSEDSIEHPEHDELMAGETGNLGNVYYSLYFYLGEEAPSQIVRTENTLPDKIHEGFSVSTSLPSTGNFIFSKYATFPIRKLLNAAKGVGFVNMPAAKDGKVRKVPLVIFLNGRLYPSLSLAVVCEYFGCKFSDIKVEPNKQISLLKDNRVMLRIPVDKYCRMLINYPGDFSGFNRSNFTSIASGYDDFKNNNVNSMGALTGLRDKIILLGFTATGTTDLRPTPFSNIYPGIGIHATVISNMLKGDFLHRPYAYLNTLLLLFLGLAVPALISRKKPVISAAIFSAVSLGYIAIAAIAFIFADLWLDVVGPILVIGFSYGAIIFNEFVSERFQKQLMENELDIASQIQQSLLPKKIPQKEGLDIGAKAQAAKHVGGDLYDLIDLGEDKVGVMIGDVSGKGVPAAIFMGRILGEFRSEVPSGKRPSEIVSVINNTVAKEEVSSMFVTLLYLEINLKEKTIAYSNGGHNPILYRPASDGKFRRLKGEEGVPVGIMEDMPFSEEAFSFKRGDIIVLFTDGINEARNKSGEEFGMDRLEKYVSDNYKMAAQELTEQLVEAVKKFFKGVPQHDDITLIILKF